MTKQSLYGEPTDRMLVLKDFPQNSICDIHYNRSYMTEAIKIVEHLFKLIGIS